MAYRWTQQEDGNFTVHNVAIFAKCKRGKFNYDESWMDRAVSIANKEEEHDYLPPAFVKHNDLGETKPFSFKRNDEETDGRLARMRRASVRAHGKRLPGIIADIVDVPKESLDKITKHRLPGRSIEAIYPSIRGKIDGLALLGRTAPFHTLAQGSEPEVAMFSVLGADETQGQVIHFAEMNAMPMNGMGGNPMVAAIQQAMQILQQAMQAGAMGGGGAPAPMGGNGGPPAGGPPAARMQLEDTPEPTPADTPEPTPAETPDQELMRVKFELFEAKVADLESRLAKATETQAQKDAALAQKDEEAKAAEAEAQITGLFSELTKENRVFSESTVREQVAKFGLESFRTHIKPALLTAPVAPPGGLPANVSDPSRNVSASMSTMDGDEDLKAFSAMAPDLRMVAFKAAEEYDAEAAKSRSFTEDNPRGSFIQSEVNRAQAALRKE